MEKLNNFIENLGSNLSGFWASLTKVKKIAIGGVSAVTLGLFATLVVSESKTDYQYLFTDLETRDKSDIANFLDKTNYSKYIIDAKGVKVAANDVDHLRLKLSQEGIPSKGTVGWEQFDNDNFARTEFEQEILKLRAIQGELARTITAIDGVKSARVHIVMPKRSLFIREEKEPSAAIYLSARRGFTLNAKQVKGIQNLVSKSVEGLSTNKIAIIDSEGNSISQSEPNDYATKQSKQLLDYKLNLEKNFESRIKSLVGKVVGFDRVDAKVDAKVDFTLEKKTISDVDPEDVVVLSKNTTGFSMQGQGLNPTGIPGSKSNVPGEQEEITSSVSKSGSKKDSEVVNYEFSKTVSEKTMAVGKILRLTVSAIVDGKQAYPRDGSTPEFVPRSDEEMKKIEELIKNSVGFEKGRDSLTVHNMLFQPDMMQVISIREQTKDDQAYLSKLAMSAAIALALVLFFAFVARPYFNWLSYDPQKKEQQVIVEEFKPESETPNIQKIKVQDELVPFDQLSDKDQVLYIAKNDSKRTTEAIRHLLSPTKSGGA